MNLIKVSRIAVVAMLMAAGSLVAVSASPAHAHTVSNHFTRGRWPRNAPSGGLNTGFPTGAWRSRVWDGKEQ